MGAFGTCLLTLLSMLFTFATLGEYANLDRFPLISVKIYVTLMVLFNSAIFI
jgi:hypothetical protein